MRSMRLSNLLRVVAGLVLLSSCQATLKDGIATCNGDGDCPSGFVCRAEQGDDTRYCFSKGSDPGRDAGTSGNGGSSGRAAGTGGSGGSGGSSGRGGAPGIGGSGTGGSGNGGSGTGGASGSDSGCGGVFGDSTFGNACFQ